MHTPEQAARESLEHLARLLNPSLPRDLGGYLLQVCLSVDGMYATAIPLEDTESE